jgi:hypothetical protein
MVRPTPVVSQFPRAKANARATSRTQASKGAVLRGGPKLGTIAMRTATGRMQIGDDWPGVFIRGDDALSYARILRLLREAAEKRAADLSPDEIAAWMQVQQLTALLDSCRVSAQH